MERPWHELDAVIHSPVRFAIASALAAADQVRFQMLRSVLEVSSSTLSKHLSLLEEAGYVRVDKRVEGRRVLTHVSLTERGREALDVHCQRLRDIADGVDISEEGTCSSRSAEREVRE